MSVIPVTNAVETQIVSELRTLIGHLGDDGGLMSSSLYETAQVLRMAPDAGGTAATAEWLLSQQADDGGWGEVGYPHARDAVTLAVALALQSRSTDRRTDAAVKAAVSFLAGRAEYWKELPVDLPTAMELRLPRLLAEASEAGLDVPAAQYAVLEPSGERKRRILLDRHLEPGSPGLASWESWGDKADPNLLDEVGSVGHSPAATAAWLQASSGIPGLDQERAGAIAYLTAAARSTCSDVPGVVPNAWPIPRFEQIWGLYALFCAGLLDHPSLRDVVGCQLDALTRALRPEGIGMSDHVLYEADSTAVLVTLLCASGRPVDVAMIDRYREGDHFMTYPGEFQASITSTAHCVCALSECGRDVDEWERRFRATQEPDGRWLLDKWHASWLYTTTQVMFAIADGAGNSPCFGAAVDGLLRHQRSDGGWGAHGSSTALETAYATLALRMAADRGVEEARGAAALSAASAWLLTHHRPDQLDGPAFWINKDLYRPMRIDRAFELAATLTVLPR